MAAPRGQRVQWRLPQLAAAPPSYTCLLAASSTGLPTRTPTRGSLAAASAARHDLFCGSGVPSCTTPPLAPPGGDSAATRPVCPPRLPASPLPVRVRPAGLTGVADHSLGGGFPRCAAAPVVWPRPVPPPRAVPPCGSRSWVRWTLCLPISSPLWPCLGGSGRVFGCLLVRGRPAVAGGICDARWSRCRRRPQGWGSSSKWTCQVHGYTRAPSVGVTWPRARTLSPRYVACWALACWVFVSGDGGVHSVPSCPYVRHGACCPAVSR